MIVGFKFILVKICRLACVSTFVSFKTKKSKTHPFLNQLRVVNCLRSLRHAVVFSGTSSWTSEVKSASLFFPFATSEYSSKIFTFSYSWHFIFTIDYGNLNFKKAACLWSLFNFKKFSRLSSHLRIILIEFIEFKSNTREFNNSYGV